MIRATTEPAEQRRHPLLFDACRCRSGRTYWCMSCRRWLRHAQQVAQRAA